MTLLSFGSHRIAFLGSFSFFPSLIGGGHDIVRATIMSMTIPNGAGSLHTRTDFGKGFLGAFHS